MSLFLLFIIEMQVEEEVDPYDLIEPVNILAMLPKDYFEKIVCSATFLSS